MIYIGDAAKLAETTVKTIRYYESIGLIPEAGRNGKYRCYDADAVKRIQFIKYCQNLGFALNEIRAILSVYDGETIPPDFALQTVGAKIDSLRKEISERSEKLARLEELLTSIGSEQCARPYPQKFSSRKKGAKS